ncbi:MULTISPECIES: DUF4097 family beta strand repeat-containing protein [unclassified Brevibacterium]|uniref:DUF4097 family beta strand repeat-containing protein n=1 Tax=unclassified Brevibacterium TaxID=2614124 RepID=UPI0010925D92|nr:DUF4097 family beta strand repeat-containing protein [Brevibacterium sp. S22]TGD29662.1 hypothetical protein EB835_16050 [Brevibacterium sp. S22]
MPATVRISESARLGLRTVLIILAVVVLLVPVIVTAAHGASRLHYGKLESSQPLPATMKELKVGLAMGASVDVRTDDDTDPTIKLNATGPRDAAPDLTVDSNGGVAEVALDEARKLENTRITVTVPTKTARDLKLILDSNYGTFDVDGDYAEIIADTDGGALFVAGSADRIRTSTDWGATSLEGTFGTVEAKTGVGAIDGENLTVTDRLDAVTSTGTLDLAFTDEAVPSGGISAKTEEGSIDLQLPNLRLANEKSDDDFVYRINAKSNDGSVDLASDLKKFDVSEDPKDAEDKTLVPISATADTGMVTVNQN